MLVINLATENVMFGIWLVPLLIVGVLFAVVAILANAALGLAIRSLPCCDVSLVVGLTPVAAEHLGALLRRPFQKLRF